MRQNAIPGSHEVRTSDDFGLLLLPASTGKKNPADSAEGVHELTTETDSRHEPADASRVIPVVVAVYR